ncbi:hypothetical protein ACHAWF_001614 [Thalassiosira exigua]
MERKEYALKARYEYKIDDFAHKGWVYFEVIRGAYGLPQSGRLTNDLLRKRLNAVTTTKPQQLLASGATSGGQSNSSS